MISLDGRGKGKQQEIVISCFDLPLLFNYTVTFNIIQGGTARHVNSTSLIDSAARIFFPMSFGILNLLYWLVYVTFQADFLHTN